MPNVLDIFNDDAFSAVELTEEFAIDKVDYKPQLLNQLGIFEQRPISTRAAAIEKREGKLQLIQTDQPGAPLAERGGDDRDIRYFGTRRLAERSTIYAESIQSTREFGSARQLEDMSAEVARRLGGPSGLISDMELTWESHRLGAVQGIVLDADGSTLDNWYTSWGISQPAEIDFALGTAATDVRKKCRDVARAMMQKAKGAWTPSTRIVGLCGDNFFDNLVNHDQIKETRLATERAPLLEDIPGYSAREIENITFINYRGTDDNTTVSIGSDKVKFFPLGARGVFQWIQAPAEFQPFVNQPGQALTVIPVPDRDRQAWVKIEVYSYPLFICTRPDMLQRGKRA